MIKVTVYQLKLQKTEDSGSIDAYVKLEIGGELIGQSSSVDDQKLYYNETFYYVASSLKDTLSLSAFISTNLAKDRIAGVAEYELSDLERFPNEANL